MTGDIKPIPPQPIQRRQTDFQATTMTALVKNNAHHDHPARKAPDAGGFGIAVEAAAVQTDHVQRALMTTLLVLYPAMATAGVAIAGLMLSGSGAIL
jgi:hypothetical protein